MTLCYIGSDLVSLRPEKPVATAENVRSQIDRLQVKRGKILLSYFTCLFGFSLVATAQEHTYTADSLMAAFDGNSKLPLKGTEITLKDVIAETKGTTVIFKSTRNDKVICELRSSTNNRIQVSLGSPLAVVGKVRGRGLLGNVTLDECSLAPVAESVVRPVTPEPVREEPATVAPDVTPEKIEALALDTIEPEPAILPAPPSKLPQIRQKNLSK